MSEKLQIRKGGKLQQTKWVYDKEKEEGQYVDTDVTDKAFFKMNEVCEIEEGVTLGDIFTLINTELELFDSVIGNWCKDIVTEGLTKPAKAYDLTDEEAIEFLELYWHLEYDDGSEYGPSFSGYHRADFHGVGIERKVDKCFDWIDKETGKPAIMYKAGERTPWGISFTPANEMINIPVKLNGEVNVFNSNTDAPTDKYHEVVHTYKGATFTLHNILYGILWEMSFHGGPEKRNEFKDELNDIVEDIKADPSSLVSAEDVLKGDK